MASGFQRTGEMVWPRGTQVCLLGVRIDCVSVRELNERVATIIKGNQKGFVLYVNAHAMNIAFEQLWFRKLLNTAAIVYCDGAGVQLAARLTGVAIPERIALTDWIWELAGFATQRGFSFFFLGASPGIAEHAARNLSARYPDLKLVGIHHGYFDHHSSENEEVIAQINRVSPDILIVAMGMPIQEGWISENWDRVNARVIMSGGGCFDFTSGAVRRSPQWMARNGLEWLFRLYLEPRRMWRRYVIGNPLFVIRILQNDVFGLGPVE